MADCWYKGNQHMHFFSSDGHDFPESVTGWCKEHGDHFIAFTEHHQHQIGERWLRGDPETPGVGHWRWIIWWANTRRGAA